MCMWGGGGVTHLQTFVKYVWSLFSTRQIGSREQRKKQLDWLVTNTDDITTQSHSLFACLREKITMGRKRRYHFVIKHKHYQSTSQNIGTPSNFF